MELKEGDKAPVFSSKDENGKSISLSDYAGKKLVLYFYPKDDTSGCTAQACNLRDNLASLHSKGYEVLGVSVDDEKSHQKFITKYNLNFPLLADTDHSVVEAYGVWKEKSMYGKNYMGIVRTTFLIDESGSIERIIGKVDTETILPRSLAEKPMNCLIADDLHPDFFDVLRNSAIGFRYLPELTRAEFLKELESAEILVIRSRFILDRQAILSAPGLKLIARAGAGLDGIDVEFAESKGIKVLHAAEGNAAAVAEHVMGMILGLLARIPEADRAIRSGIWDREGFRGKELGHRCVGLIGYGNMGPAVASRLSSFGCRIIAYDKYRADWPDDFAERVGAEEIQNVADIISLHVPLTAETEGMIDREYLNRCRKGLVLINTSRGPVLNPEGLDQLLGTGQLGGLGLDVFPEEPLFKKNISSEDEIYRIISRPNVLASPHVAGWTSESYAKISRVLADKIRQFICH